MEGQCEATPPCSREVLQALLDMRRDMAVAKEHSVTMTDRLIQSIDLLGQRITDAVATQQQSVPIKLVFMIFALVFGLVFGIEVLQHFIRAGLLG